MPAALEWTHKYRASASARDMIIFKVAGCQNRSDDERLCSKLLSRGHGQPEETKSKNGKTTLVFTVYDDSAVSVEG